MAVLDAGGTCRWTGTTRSSYLFAIWDTVYSMLGEQDMELQVTQPCPLSPVSPNQGT